MGDAKVLSRNESLLLCVVIELVGLTVTRVAQAL